MSAVTTAKAFRVTFEERYRRHVDVLAVAAWQAIELAQVLYEARASALDAEDEFPVYTGEWSAEPLQIGGQS